MDEVKLASDLIKIVPTWKTVNLTKAGYNKQYVETIENLVKYIKQLENK